MIFFLYLKKFCLDAGFGGQYSPTVNGRNSSIDNLRLAKGVGNYLLNKGQLVFLTRTNLEYVDVISRASFSSYVGCNLFISLKRNSADQALNAGVEIRIPMNFTNNDLLFRNITLENLLSPGISKPHVHQITIDETVLNRASSPSITLFLLFLPNLRENMLFDEYFSLWCEIIGNSLLNFSNLIV